MFRNLQNWKNHVIKFWHLQILLFIFDYILYIFFILKFSFNEYRLSCTIIIKSKFWIMRQIDNSFKRFRKIFNTTILIVITKDFFNVFAIFINYLFNYQIVKFFFFDFVKNNDSIVLFTLTTIISFLKSTIMKI